MTSNSAPKVLLAIEACIGLAFGLWGLSAPVSMWPNYHRPRGRQARLTNFARTHTQPGEFALRSSFVPNSRGHFAADAFPGLPGWEGRDRGQIAPGAILGQIRPGAWK